MENFGDSNIIGLDEIINKDNFDGDINDIKKIDKSILAPTEYTYFEKDLFGESDTTSSIEVSREKKKKKKKSESNEKFSSLISESKNETSEESQSDESDADSSCDSDITSESIKKFNFNTIKKTGTKNFVSLNNTKDLKKDKSVDNHAQILNSILSYKERFKEKKIPIPHFNEKRTQKNIKYAQEIKEMLQNSMDDNRFALVTSSIIDVCLKFLCGFFNEKRVKIKGFNFDLTGYDLMVKREIGEFYSDFMDVGDNIRKKYGRTPIKILTLIKILFINGGFVLYKNNTSANNMNRLNFNQDDISENSYSSDMENSSEISSSDEDSSSSS